MNNLLKRTIFGALYLVVMVFGIIWDRAIFTALFAFILMVGLREFYAMGLGRRYLVQQKIATLCAILAYLNLAYRCFFGGQIDLWWVPMLLSCATLLVALSIVFMPQLYGNMLMMVIGAILIVEAVSDLVSIHRLSSFARDVRVTYTIDD